ncbi:MAG: pyridoxamine kinase [Bacteroides sp.]|nr:pyridoxamine kinase [Bacteroides sp.]MCM1548338.1 pyridoxamine kinase [Clostridium sp.]
MKTISHNNQKKIAVINDISGFGRCSITVSLPIISHMRLQCCPLPTSIFSNHTGYEHYFFDDYTDKMREYIRNWKQLGLEFEGIATGFLGSKEQIQIVEEFIQEFRTEQTKVIVDPVMGDNGVLYPTYTEEMRKEMKKLVSYADILTPNLTECCFLTDTPYRETDWSARELYAMAEKLSHVGAEKIVISGVVMGEYLGNVVYETDGTRKILRSKRVAQERAGTGDIFSSIIAADCINQVDFTKSVRKAVRFIKDCMIITDERGIPAEDGVCFEEILYRLK